MSTIKNHTDNTV